MKITDSLLTLPLLSPRGLSLRPGRGAYGGLFRLGAVLILVAVLAACAGDEASEGEEAAGETPVAAERLTTVGVTSPELRTVEDVAVLPAELLPNRRAILAAEVPGRVEAVRFEEGQTVGAGSLLVQIDTRSLAQAVAEAEAAMRQAQDQYERAEALFERRSITRSQLVDTTAARDVAEARLASARLQLDKSRIRSPWRGQVAERHVEVGDYVTPGQPVAELVDVDRLKVRAPAPASDVPYLEVGMPVVVRVDSLPGETFPGKVARLGTEVASASRTLDVEVEMENPGGKLRPGLLARMEVPRRTLDQALVVPMAAVVDLGGIDAVYVLEDGKARRRQVELGPVVGDGVVVSSGLGPDARVIVDGAQLVADGQRVLAAGPSMPGTESDGAGTAPAEDPAAEGGTTR